jgi:uncharacterized protein involved in response to NO
MTSANLSSATPRVDGAVSRWRSEPFRVFFVLGVLSAWVGVGHWLTYATGVTSTFSCEFHGLVQMQAFMMAFAIGFLLTALPRRTQSPPVSRVEMSVLVVALFVTVGAAIADLWTISEIAYASLFVVLAEFALRRFLRGEAGRRPPAAFVLLPIAGLQGVAGAILRIVGQAQDAPAWPGYLGRLLIEQGVFLCLVIGVGSLVLPLIGGTPPPPDLGSSPRETRKAIAYAAAGCAIIASLVLEQVGFDRSGPILRAVVVAAGLGFGGGALRLPGKPGAHRKLVWVSIWLMPVGLIVSAIWPDYRVPALHILFIGGFGLLAFGVGTHVALSHLGMEHLALKRPLAVIVLGAAFLIALAARLAADMSHTYFIHLGWAAAVWIFGTAVWLIWLGPRMLRQQG